MIFPQQQILHYYEVANKAAGVSQQMEVKKKSFPLPTTHQTQVLTETNSLVAAS